MTKDLNRAVGHGGGGWREDTLMLGLSLKYARKVEVKADWGRRGLVGTLSLMWRQTGWILEKSVRWVGRHGLTCNHWHFL